MFAAACDPLPSQRAVECTSVATKQNKGARLHLPKQSCRFTIQFLSGHTGHDQLAERIRFHGRQRWTLSVQLSMPVFEAVILSGAKNLRSEMFRFAQHDRILS